LSKLPDASENTIKLIDEKVKLINDDKYNELKDESDFYGGKRTRKRIDVDRLIFKLTK
jgi:hypothetical protein